MSKYDIGIVGCGLAGSACGYVLQKAGYNVIAYEEHSTIAPEASGNLLALFSPRLRIFYDSISHMYNVGCHELINILKSLHISYGNACGALHVINNEERANKYRKLLTNWHKHDTNIQLLDAEHASRVSNILINNQCIFTTNAGWINPRKLCEKYLEKCTVSLNTKIQHLQEIDADIVILANGINVLEVPELSHLPIYSVRGQITHVNTNYILENLSTNILCNGYISCTQNNAHVIGATFQKWVQDPMISEEDHQFNLSKLYNDLGKDTIGALTIIGGRVGFRCVSEDRIPIIDKVGNLHNKEVYISTGHGSHGSISSIIGAHVINDLIQKISNPFYNILRMDRFKR